MYEFFNQGWVAYLCEIQKDDCPYAVNSLEGIDWLEGWRLCEVDELGEQDED